MLIDAFQLSAVMDGDGVKDMLRRSLRDMKVNVRKAAMQTLEFVIKLDGDLFNKEVGSHLLISYCFLATLLTKTT